MEEKEPKTIEKRSTEEQIDSYLRRINDLLGLQSGKPYDVDGLSVEGKLSLVWKKASESLNAEAKVPKHLLQFLKGFDAALNFIKKNPEFLHKLNSLHTSYWIPQIGTPHDELTHGTHIYLEPEDANTKKAKTWVGISRRIWPIDESLFQKEYMGKFFNDNSDLYIRFYLYFCDKYPILIGPVHDKKVHNFRHRVRSVIFANISDMNPSQINRRIQEIEKTEENPLGNIEILIKQNHDIFTGLSKVITSIFQEIFSDKGEQDVKGWED